MYDFCSKIFLHKNAINWNLQWTVMLEMISVSNTVLSSFTVYTKIFNNTNIEYWNQYIRMISEGSCDAEDWSNEAENTALYHRNKLYLKLY